MLVPQNSTPIEGLAGFGVVRLHVADPVLMHVAAEKNGIGEACACASMRSCGRGQRVAVPAVVPERVDRDRTGNRAVRTAFAGRARSSPCFRARKRRRASASCACTEQRALGIVPLGAACAGSTVLEPRSAAAGAGLRIAILPVVDEVERRQRAEAHTWNGCASRRRSPRPANGAGEDRGARAACARSTPGTRRRAARRNPRRACRSGPPSVPRSRSALRGRPTSGATDRRRASAWRSGSDLWSA